MALLRAGSEFHGQDLDLGGIAAGGGYDGGIAHGGLILAFAEAAVAGDAAARAANLARIADALGPGAAIDAAGVAAIFEAVVRIADATGIPLEPAKADATAADRAALGIDAYPAAGPEGPRRGWA